MVSSTILFGVIGFLAGVLGGVPTLLAATFGAVTWGLIGGWIAQLAMGHLVIRTLIFVVTLQAAFLLGLALRTIMRR